MGRVLAFLFGVVSYVLFLVAFLYAIAWVNNVSMPEWVPYTIDNGRMSGSLIEALLINSGLLGLFAVQHSIMARIWFKKIWTRIIPEAIERSIFVLLTSLILFLMYWQWRTLGEPVWDLTGTTAGMALEVVGYIGWLIVLLSTFMINHFDLFGLRQVTLYLQKKPYTPVEFKTTGLYSMLRHPLMLGFMIAFWASADMTVGHLFFAIMTTAYMFVGIYFEEKDTAVYLGDPYVKYRREVSMIVPMPRKK